MQAKSKMIELVLGLNTLNKISSKLPSMKRITFTLFALVISVMACTALAQINAHTLEGVSFIA